jgi:hypothetical protein
LAYHLVPVIAQLCDFEIRHPAAAIGQSAEHAAELVRVATGLAESSPRRLPRAVFCRGTPRLWRRSGRRSQRAVCADRDAGSPRLAASCLASAAHGLQLRDELVVAVMRICLELRHVDDIGVCSAVEGLIPIQTALPRPPPKPLPEVARAIKVRDIAACRRR